MKRQSEPHETSDIWALAIHWLADGDYKGRLPRVIKLTAFGAFASFLRVRNADGYGRCALPGHKLVMT